MKLINGDCLEEMKKIKSGSVDLILCDLPYGTMKGAGLDGWNSETTAWDNQLDIKKMFEQYERVCREGASIILFSQEPYTSKLRTYKQNNIEFSYPLIWKKDHFANALISKKAPVSYFEDLNVFYKKYDCQNLNQLRIYSRELIKWIGLNKKQIIEVIGQKADHFFRCESMQFKLCTEDTYKELILKLHINKWDGFKTYNELLSINEKYSKIFNVPSDKNFIGNVLEFKKDYLRLHPTQKPTALLEYLIRTYTNEHNTVLDNCMGSGSTGVACVNTNRNFIGIELDKQYFDIATKRINEQLETFAYTE